MISKKEVKITKHPIDSAMTLPNGRKVEDMRSLKDAMLSDKERILKGILGKLVSYAIGRETTVADRPYIDEVYASIEPKGFSLRAAIHAVVAHPEFGRK